MDVHMNVFQAYHGGNQDSPERVNRLEDNLTRAFVICLKYLQDEGVLKEYLAALCFKNIPETLEFDLQNMGDKKSLRSVQKSTNQWLLLIARDHYEFHWTKTDEDKFKLIEPLLESSDDYKTEKEALLKELHRGFKAKATVTYKALTIEADEVSSYYDLLHECRPDAWIYDANTASPFAILVESKVGTNKLTNAQVYRHLSGRYGFGLGDQATGFDGSRIVSVTWGEIVGAFDRVSLKEKGLCEEIINQFTEYMKMSGEILDLKQLNENYDEDIAKVQFALFLDALDKQMGIQCPHLVRAKRPLDGLWDYYGVKEDDKILQDPHFSIFLTSEGIGASLTVKQEGRIRKILKDGDVRAFLSKIIEQDEGHRQRYRIDQGMYRLLDHKKGQIRGDKYNSFSFFVNFEELARGSKISLEQILEVAEKCAPISKQLDVSFQCDWVDADKAEKSSPGEDTLRRANLRLIDNPEELITALVDFIEQLQVVLMNSHQIQ